MGQPKTYGPGDPACDDAAFAIIIENFDEEKSYMLELRRQRIQGCCDRIFSNTQHWFKVWYAAQLPGWKQNVGRSEVLALALALLGAQNPVIVLASDYASQILDFVRDKTLEGLKLFHDTIDLEMNLQTLPPKLLHKRPVWWNFIRPEARFGAN